MASPLSGVGPVPVFVVSGPSGAGKTSLCAEVLKRLRWLEASVSHTTRPSRPGEVDGRDYIFVDRETFLRMVEKGEFLEWADVHGHLYGSSQENLRRLNGKNKTLLFEVDCKGARQIRERVGQAVLIFVMAPSAGDLIARIRKRGNIGAEELSVRVRTAAFEIEQAAHFDYLVINDRFDDAVRELLSILVAECCRTRYREPAWRERWRKELERYRGDPESSGT